MIVQPIYKNFLFFIFMYLLGTLCVVTTTDRSYFPFYLKLFFELFLDVYLLCCILSILPLKARTITSWILAGILYIVAIIDLFCYIRIDSTISPSIFQLTMETNSVEAKGFLTSYISPDIFISPVGIVLFLILSHILVALFFKKSFLFQKYPYIINGIVILLLIIGFVAGLRNKKNIIQTWKYDSLGQVEEFFSTEYFVSSAQYLPIHRLAFAVHAYHLAQNETVQLKHVMEMTIIDSCHFTSPNIVLIIGESYNKHHSQLYGYKQLTTPNQLHRKQLQELYLFSNAVTPYNLTSEVLKNAFSLNDLSKNEAWCDKPMFTNIFKKAGYQVVLLSNQFIMKQQKAMADFTGGMFLNDPELNKLQFDIRNKRIHKYDEELINDYQVLCNKYKTEQRLIIFSLLGQHTDYTERYPPEFAKFHLNDYQRKDLDNTQLQIVADYDNATFYNDHVVDKILRLFEKDDAIVIYMADHGDECYDQNKTFGRQHSDPVTKGVAINEFEIPFWIWCSKKYMQSHPTIVKQIHESIDKRFYSDDLSHLMLYLGGISCKDYNDEYNIISPSYNNKRKRILRKSTDYDLLFSK